MDEYPQRGVILGAALSLVAFSALTGMALLAWFTRAPSPWGWRSALAMFAAVFGLCVAAIVWRAPSRSSVMVGIVVMVGSLVRIGPPSEWTWVSGTLVATTLVLVVPLILAANALR